MTQGMRITFVLPYAGLSGGVRVIAIYAKLLAERGHQVTVVSLPPKPMGLRKSALLVFRSPSALWRREDSFLDGLDIDHRVIESDRPVADGDVPDADVVVATWWKTVPWVAAMSPRKGAKVFFAQGFEVEPGQFNPEMDAAWRLPLHKIVISNWLRDLAMRRFDDHDVSLVPNSVDHGVFHAAERNPSHPPKVGALYSPGRIKGFDIVLGAFEKAASRFAGVRLMCFGAVKPEPRLRFPPNAHFQLRPPQPEIVKLYSSCNVWLCGSRTEGFHLPPLEAMACGCPVVSTRVGGPADIIEDGREGYLVDIDDVDALGARLIDVLSLGPTAWRRMSEAARQKARSATWDDRAVLFEMALQRAIQKGT